MRLTLRTSIYVRDKLCILFGKIAENKYPFMAWMGTCGASLVDPYWILTAAHCTNKFLEKPKPIHFGSNLRGKGWSTKHTAVFKHPKFVHNKIKDRVIHDIALIKLENPVPSEIGTPIKLPNNPPVSNYDKFNATMIGWGYNSIPFLAPSDYLLEAKLVMGGNLPYTFCQIPGKLCSLVSTDEGPRMAPGDSGGPLFFEVNNEFIQIGIITVLWLHPLKAYINEFTDVAYYSKWVNTIMSTH